MNRIQPEDIDIQYLLANNCIPTLLGLKPSSLISIYKNRPDWNNVIKKINIQVKYFHCKIAVLYENNDMANLLIYNEKLLNRLISCDAVKQFLASFGYRLSENTLTEILNTLRRRFEKFHSLTNHKEEYCFPHEIGVLLGYPLEDVEAFIRYQGKGYVLCGCWKVYYNEEEALRIFRIYKELQQNTIDMLKQGKKLVDIYYI